MLVFFFCKSVWWKLCACAKSNASRDQQAHLHVKAAWITNELHYAPSRHTSSFGHSQSTLGQSEPFPNNFESHRSQNQASCGITLLAPHAETKPSRATEKAGTFCFLKIKYLKKKKRLLSWQEQNCHKLNKRLTVVILTLLYIYKHFVRRSLNICTSTLEVHKLNQTT